ncbi:MAG TPA: aspartate aminotransferase family protein [Patescibacteria group bacterium]|nr:aspartate aminotransferase family protein [Patescibacteria group bacterium]
MLDYQALQMDDNAHLLHPLHHPNSHKAPLIITGGHGIWVQTVDGKKFIDGLAGLWNILIGHGNQELAEAAYAQMQQLAYFSNYIGVSNLPAIELASKLAGYAYPSLTSTYFTSGGAEANESAFKTARYYWKRLGKPTKVKFIARQDAYHGVTMATMSATGITPYWPMFEPRVPGFLHTHAPYPYRYEGDIKPGETIGHAAARALEEAIIAEGPDTVAAIIAEPVQGAGGVIVPPNDYFPRVREICDKYQVLLIADEVITGFGRTGENFALHRWGVEPDIMTFAKGITSGYLPLGGMQISDQIHEAILSAPPRQSWMHAYTYSGHATCCAVALKNLEILEREKLTERAEKMGEKLLAGLEMMRDIDCVGNVRGLGLMCAIEFVADKETKASAGIAGPILQSCQQKGLISRIKGESLLLAPPLIINEDEIDQILFIVREAIEEVWEKSQN